MEPHVALCPDPGGLLFNPGSGAIGLNLGRVLLGLLFVITGVAWLGANLGWVPPVWPGIDFLIEHSHYVIPIAAILLGVILLFAGRGHSIIALAVLFMLAIPAGYYLWPGAGGQSGLSVPMEAGIHSARLRIDAPIGSIKIAGSGGDQLLTGSLFGISREHRLSRQISGNRADLSLRMDGTGLLLGPAQSRGKAELLINSDVAWDLDLDIGAAALDLDLRDVMVSGLYIDAGAASVTATFGDLTPGARLIIEAGAGNIKLTFPPSVGVQVSLDPGIGRETLPEFDRLSSRTYRSTNWDHVDTHVFLGIGAGLHSLTIDWSGYLGNRI